MRRDRTGPAERGVRLLARRQVGALEVNESLVGVCEEHGEELSFGSRTKAETFARRLSTEDGSLRVQAAAPNDSSGDDGYLLAEYDRSVREPPLWTGRRGRSMSGRTEGDNRPASGQ